MPHSAYQNTLGILVGGGPAPGLNGAISAATIEAINHGSKVLGILDNAKPNADRRLDMVAELIAKKYERAGVVKRRKPGASRGAPQEILDELARECDFVIVGVGD